MKQYAIEVHNLKQVFETVVTDFESPKNDNHCISYENGATWRY